MASISILALITARARPLCGEDRILEHFAEYLVVASEISGIGKVGGGTHDIGERRALLRENALDAFNGRAGFDFDRAVDHVAVGVFGDLAAKRKYSRRPARRDERAGSGFSCRSDIYAGWLWSRRPFGRLLGESAGFDDVDAVQAVDQIDEPAAVDGHVV